ncbi:DivIVA domain-containing protein [Sanguibacter massiliensis]|uniref:DivIVA domain-containing protein n=1 Tax=Sanguibacter massiliensis TaxID=1973217 RepID=UPI000C83870F|nr:DivIVA domain-containing protein [Sanguibacter massiliensis]
MLTAADVRSARFTATKFRSGYEIAEVDALLARAARTLEHLEQGLTVESDGTPLLTPDDLLHARFSPTELTEGYFVDEVDDLLDGIIDSLNTYIGRATRGEPLVQPAPSAAADDIEANDGRGDAHEGDAGDAADAGEVVQDHASAEAVHEASAGSTATVDAWAVALQETAPAAAHETSVDPTPVDTVAEDEPFPSAPVWSPPASTDVTPAWDAPAAPVAEPQSPPPADTAGPFDTTRSFATAERPEDLALSANVTPVTPAEDLDPVASLADTTEPGASEDLADGSAVAPDDAWAQPAEPSSAWAAPEPVRWTAPESDDAPESDTAPDATAETRADDLVAADDATAEVGTPSDPWAPPAANAPGADVNANDDAPAPWEPGFVAPAAPVATPDWGFNAPAAPVADEWSSAPAAPLAEASADEASAAGALAPHTTTPLEPAAEPHDEDLVDDSLLASTDESPWASLDGDEPIALDLDSEVRDAESADAELPAWLTDAQPEMASAPEPVLEAPVVDEPATDTPAADAPTRVSAFAFAAQPADTDPDLDAPTVLMDAVQAPDATAVAPEHEPAAVSAPVDITSAPVAAPTFDAPTFDAPTFDAPNTSVEAPDAPAVAEHAPYVAPAEALDSQGFLRQLTFARATSTGSAKDSITLVGPDGRVFSAVGVRKTPEGLVVDLG